MTRHSFFAIAHFAAALGATLLSGAPAHADTIRNPTATFAGLDKITGRIISFDVAIDETVQFGTLQITPRVCLTRPQTETPLTEGFVEVDDVDAAKQARRIFSGWMFAASPGLHGVEHPIYDVWLKDCKGGVEVVASPPAGAPNANAPPPANATPAPKEPVAAKKPRRTIEPQNPVEPAMDLPPEPPPAADDAPPPGAPPPAGLDNSGGNGAGNSLGAPVEVGPPPGAAPPPAAKPAAPKPPKPRRKPPPPPPGDEPFPGGREERVPLEPVTPDVLPRDPFFR